VLRFLAGKRVLSFAGGRDLWSRAKNHARKLGSAIRNTWLREVRASIAPLMSQKQTLTLAAGFSNVSERDLFGPVYFDAIRTISLNGDYRLQDNLGGTNFLTLNWRARARHPRRVRQERSLNFSVERVAEILRAVFLVHALPDPQRSVVAEACIGRPDGLGPDVPVAAILSRRSRLRPRLRAAQISGDNEVAGSA